MDTVIARDFASGVSAEDVPDVGMIQGEVRRQQVILARRGDEFFAVGAKCPHYGGSLGKGLQKKRYPWPA
jgi:nitrite reductase/ring-hydroxylating ferredoxin subunit